MRSAAPLCSTCRNCCSDLPGSPQPSATALGLCPNFIPNCRPANAGRFTASWPNLSRTLSTQERNSSWRQRQPGTREERTVPSSSFRMFMSNPILFVHLTARVGFITIARFNDAMLELCKTLSYQTDYSLADVKRTPS